MTQSLKPLKQRISDQKVNTSTLEKEWKYWEKYFPKPYVSAYETSEH